MNDGGVGPGGRFWEGLLRESRTDGGLYRLGPNGRVSESEIEVVTPNGLDWVPGGDVMYLTDSQPRVIIAFDFDVSTGALSERRVFADVPDGEGGPDGLTVDADGFVWSARFGGGRIVRYDPDGKVPESIDLPTSCPTSCTFGGQHLDELYVTSSRAHVPRPERRRVDGSVLRLEPGVQGTTAFRFEN